MLLFFILIAMLTIFGVVVAIWFIMFSVIGLIDDLKRPVESTRTGINEFRT